VETLPEVIQVLTLTLNLLKIVGVPGIISLMVLYPGIIIFLWITHERQVRKILDTYGSDMQEIRLMYERNVSLVKEGGRREDILQEILIKNTEALTRLAAELKGRRRV
jgi:hypothetical protein